jgi:ribonuclease E
VSEQPSRDEEPTESEKPSRRRRAPLPKRRGCSAEEEASSPASFSDDPPMATATVAPSVARDVPSDEDDWEPAPAPPAAAGDASERDGAAVAAAEVEAPRSEAPELANETTADGVSADGKETAPERRPRRRRGGRRGESTAVEAEAGADDGAGAAVETVDRTDVPESEPAGGDGERVEEEELARPRRPRRRGGRGGRREPAENTELAAAPSAGVEDDGSAGDVAVEERESGAPDGEGEAPHSRSRRRRGGARRGGHEEAGKAQSASADGPAEPPAAKKHSFSRILVDAIDKQEIRIALLENGQVEELYYDRPYEKKYLGNIYRGRVMNVEPAIQAAFVEIGIGRNGFLHVSDVLPAYKDAQGIPIDNLSLRLADRRRLRIQEILEPGQELLVQISKDAIGAKGPSLTTYVSVPGKFLVLMPGVNRHGVSKRIQDNQERATLRKSLAKLDPPQGMGFILRTAAEDCEPEELEKDFEYLMGVWDQVHRNSGPERGPGLVYAESELIIRTLRDLYGPEVDEVLVNDEEVYERARQFLLEVNPEAAKNLKRYTGVAPLFTKFGVEEEIEKIYNRRAPLPSGGHIVVEQTEALVAIDVNSGRYRGEEDLEATALKTNVEAAQEIARQLRLRDLGGVIINDFIDMEVEANRRQVEDTLRDALKRDKAKSWITRISRFGIVEMTRQRVRPSFERATHESCQHCKGLGFVKAPRSAGIHILRQVRAGLASKRRKVCEVVVPPGVGEYLLNERRDSLTELESLFRKTVRVLVDRRLSPDQYEIRFQ